MAFPYNLASVCFIIITSTCFALIGCGGEQRLSQPSADAGSAWISGVVELHSGLQSEVPSGAYLTLTLYPLGADGPGDFPIARVESAIVSFPFRFALSEEARLRGPAFEGLPLAGPMLLRAHVSQTAMSAPAPGNLIGDVEVKRGQRDVVLLIDGRVAAP